MKKLANTLAGFPWIIKVLLAILLDGFFGGIIRIGLGTKPFSKIAGWILLLGYIAILLSLGITLPKVIAWIIWAIYWVCAVCDIITVIFTGKVKIFAK